MLYWRAVMKVTPETAAGAWQALIVALVIGLWLASPFDHAAVPRAAGLVVILLVCGTLAARYRGLLVRGSLLADQLVIAAGASIWPGAWFALMLPAFDGIRTNRVPWILPGPVLAIVVSATAVPLPRADMALLPAMVATVVVACALRSWAAERDTLYRELDATRAVRYELERSREAWFDEHARLARTIERSERDRIARELHDHVGHQLAGASLAARTLERFLPELSGEASLMFRQLRERLDDSTRLMRKAVHDMKPVTRLGVDRLREICEAVPAAEVFFSSGGDPERVDSWLWGMLEPCLKEGLTNALRHAPGSDVHVTLDVSPRIVRLRIHNDRGTEDRGSGKPRAGDHRAEDYGRAEDRRAYDRSAELAHPAATGTPGLGLRGIRRRARAVGGSVTVDTSSGFSLVCVLPLGGQDA